MHQGSDEVWCIPVFTEEEEEPKPPPEPVPVFSEKPIKPLTGGPPPRGKWKPPPEPQAIGGEAAAAIHRAIAIKR